MQVQSRDKYHEDRSCYLATYLTKTATYYLDLGRRLRDINRIGGKISLYCVTSSKLSPGSSSNTMIEALRNDIYYDC